MSADDIIYAPIVPADQLRELVKRIMQNPMKREILDTVSDQIVELFGKHGVYDEQNIVDAVYRTIKELEGHLLVLIIPQQEPPRPKVRRNTA